MSTPKKPTTTAAPQLPDPPAGGRYRREADGSLTQTHHTAPATGRRPESQAALQQRSADAAPKE